MTNNLKSNSTKTDFNYQDWLDGFTEKIESIPYISAWTGHTVKIVNQQTKKIDFAGNWSMDNEEDIVALSRLVYDYYSRKHYFSYRFDSVDGWVAQDKDSHPMNFGNTVGFGMYSPTQIVNKFAEWSSNPTAHKVLWKVAVNLEGRGQDGNAIFVYFPEYNTIRRLGYWEYKTYWLTKYIPYKIKNNYGWKSWTNIKQGLSK